MGNAFRCIGITPTMKLVATPVDIFTCGHSLLSQPLRFESEPRPCCLHRITRESRNGSHTATSVRVRIGQMIHYLGICSSKPAFPPSRKVITSIMIPLALYYNQRDHQSFRPLSFPHVEYSQHHPLYSIPLSTFRGTRSDLLHYAVSTIHPRSR